MKQMEVMVPVQDEDFSFDRVDSVPVRPQGFGNYFFSAPTSPLCQPLDCNYNLEFGENCSDDNTFAFSTGSGLDLTRFSSADELFERGKIKFCQPNRKNIFQNTLSFGRNNKVCSEHLAISKDNAEDTFLSKSSGVGWLRKKWRLRDFLLFRGVSEGHETNKEYNFLRKFKEGDLKNSSAQKKKKNQQKAVVALSAHERHYKVKRAAAEEMRKRTYLPYKQNLMIGCMDVSAAGVTDPSRVAIRIR